MTGRRPLRRVLVPLALPWVVLSSGCTDLGDNVVVTIGSRSMDAGELREIHAGIDAPNRLPLDTHAARLHFVQQVVERALLVEEGERLLTTDEQLREELRNETEDALIRRLRTIEGSDVTLDTTTVRLAQERMSTQHHVLTHRFASRQDAQSGRQALLDGGEAAPARQNAPPVNRWFTWTPLPDPIGDVVSGFAIGDVSSPIFARGWWNIVQLLERRNVDPGTQSALRPLILRGLRVRAETEAGEDLVVQLRNGRSARVDDDAIDWLAERTRQSIRGPDASEGDTDWALPGFSAQETGRLIAEWDGGGLTALDYRRRMARVPRGQRPRGPGLRTAIRGRVETLVDRKLLAQEARRRGLESDMWVREMSRRQREERLVQHAIAHIRSVAPSDAPADSLVELLKTTQPQLFRRPARARILRLDLPSRAIAEAEIDAVRASGGGQAWLHQLLESDRPMQGSYHLVALDQNPNLTQLAREVFAGGSGTISGPHDVGGTWVVAVCLEIVPAEIFGQAELDRLSRQLGATRDPVSEWIRRRRAQVGISIDEDALRAIGPGG